MEKTIYLLLIISLILTNLFVLTGCKKEQNQSLDQTQTSSNELVSYILSMELDENQFIQVKVDYPKSDDILLTPDEYEKNKVTFTNNAKNYELKLSLGEEVESTYLENQKVDKEEEGYTTAKFADNDGYYYLFGKTTILGSVLIDTLTDNVYKYVYFELSTLDNESEILPIMKEQEVQNILSSFGFRYITGSIEESTSTESSESIIGQWEHLSYVYTFNEDKTGTYNASGISMNFEYEINDKNLSILFNGNTDPTILNYRINGNKLTITDSFGEDVIYTKK